MATQELNVKFKVDASDVTSGSKEAKDKVKDAANQMANDVKSSSQKMEQSFKDVAKSTDSIKDATKTATTAVKTMETQVDSSAKNMEKSMDSVSKKMSAMQAFSMGSRGIGIVGGLGQEIAKSFGAEETASNIGVATSIGQTAMQGAAAGFAMAGPAGAVIGGLTGAAQSLLKAGNDLQEAAKSQDERAKSDLETRRREIVHQNSVDKWTQEANTLANNAYGNGIVFGTDEGKSTLNANITAQRNRIADLTAQRDAIAMNYDENGDVFAQAEQMRALEDSIAFATEKLNIFLQAAEAAAQVEQQAIAATEAGVKAAQDAIEARKQEAQSIRRRQEEADARERARQEAQIARDAEKAQRDAQKEEEKNLNGQLKEGQATLADLQSELNGQMRSNASGPSDALIKMGGGAGYTSYNNSVESVQKTISDDLKTLIKNQTAYNTNIETKLQELIDKPNGANVWGE